MQSAVPSWKSHITMKEENYYSGTHRDNSTDQIPMLIQKDHELYRNVLFIKSIWIKHCYYTRTLLLNNLTHKYSLKFVI